MKQLLLSFVTIIGLTGVSIAQCTLGSPFGSGTAPAPGSSVTMTTCAYAGEYSTVSSANAGQQYTVTNTGGVSNYVTIFDASFTPIAWGVSPLVFTAPSSGTYYSQGNLDDGLCGTDASCHTYSWAATAASCPQPTNLTLDLNDQTSAQFSWLEAGSATEWQLEYGPIGFTNGTGTIINTTNNPETITGLAPDTFYEVYVQAVCTPGDSSLFTGPVLFHTYIQDSIMDWDSECPPSGFIDISATGTDLNLTDDSEAGVTLPFPLLFQNTVVTEITVGNNGGVEFYTLTGNIGLSNITIQGDGLYPFLTDLDSDISGIEVPGVFYEQIGTSPNSQFVIMWKDRTRYSGSTNIDPCTFEIIIDEATFEIYFVYEDVDFSNPAYDNGADAEIGVNGVQDILVSADDPTYLSANSCVHFFYTNCGGAGIDSSIVVCENEPFDLFDGLGGQYNTNGVWYDPYNNAQPSSFATASPIFGLFNYDYIVESNVCGFDTSMVTVDVNANCDYLKLYEKNLDAVTIYPNPTSDVFYISNGGSIEVFSYMLTDINGKIITSMNDVINGSEATAVDIKNLETGIYLVKVFNQNGEKTFRIVKQ